MRKYLHLTAVVGATGIALGAFGAHALKDTLAARGTLAIWQTAGLYHLVHAPALLAAALYVVEKHSAARDLARSCACWTIGVVLFSGSLYALALGAPRWLGSLTPAGGLLLIAGWLCVLRHALTSKPPAA